MSLISLKIIQTFHLLLGYAENQIVLWNFKIQNSVRITEGSDNGDSDNRGPTVLEMCDLEWFSKIQSHNTFAIVIITQSRLSLTICNYCWMLLSSLHFWTLLKEALWLTKMLVTSRNYLMSQSQRRSSSQ